VGGFQSARRHPTHLTLPHRSAMGPLPLPPWKGGERRPRFVFMGTTPSRPPRGLAAFRALSRDPGDDPLAGRGRTAFSRTGLVGDRHLQGAEPASTGAWRRAKGVAASSGGDCRDLGRKSRPWAPASSAMTRRPVFSATEARIVSRSNGTSVRGSTTSTEIPSFSNLPRLRRAPRGRAQARGDGP